ncbi:MAG: hypothetical protein RIQ81_6 [Pseudomonadota bacterium]
MKTALAVIPFLLATTLGGCASSAQPEPAKQQPGQAIQSGGRLQPGNQIQDLPASSWRINYQGRSMSLQAALAATGKKAAIFQFAGVTCNTCQADAREFTSSLQSAGGNSVAHVVVFTDFLEDFQDQDFAGFMGTWAPASLRAHDERSSLWLSLQNDPSKPDRNVIVVLGQNGRGMFTNLPHPNSAVLSALRTLASSN